MNDMDAGHGNDRTTTSLGKRIAASLPTLLVLGALGAVGAWGHSTGWKAPPFRSLFGGADVAPVDDWCAEHGVPESKCIACNPELAGADPADWCAEHGVAESRCALCNPDLVASDWCDEHGLPESSCTICNPGIAHVQTQAPDTSHARVSHGSHDHERPEDHPAGEAPVAEKALRDARTCQKHALKVQFASSASMAKAGVELGSAVERPMADSIVVNAEVDYERTRFARVSSRAAGVARRVLREQGAAVRAGDVLAIVDAAEVGRAKTELLQAEAAVQAARASAARTRASSDAGFRTEAETLQADALLRQAELRVLDARQSLASFGFDVPSNVASQEAVLSLGLPPELRATLPAGADAANWIPLLAPLDGIVVTRELVAGETVEPGRMLFEIADTRRMWVTMDVPQVHAHRIALGHEVIFRPDDARDEVATGAVTWISTAVDEMTRTVKVRAELSNQDAALRAHSFGRAQIVVRTSPNATAVPKEAVQWEGCCYVVFVQIASEVFQTRKVRLGANDAAFTEVVAGLLPGEVVATKGSYVLKSEILKSSLGAGCTDD